MRPTVKVLSASVSSMRVFQNRRLSGKPSRSRGPGSNSRKKAASWASKDRNPFGTILMSSRSEIGVVGVAEVASERLEAIEVDGGGTTAGEEREPNPLASGLNCWLPVC